MFFKISDILIGFFDVCLKNKNQLPSPLSLLPFSLTKGSRVTQDTGLRGLREETKSGKQEVPCLPRWYCQVSRTVSKQMPQPSC